MTDHEAFEQQCALMGFLPTQAHFETWKAAIAHERSKAPAWKDAPDAPGLWVVGSRCLHINELDLPAYQNSRVRWYGPVPDGSQ